VLSLTVEKEEKDNENADEADGSKCRAYDGGLRSGKYEILR
jgi:hypothetical protein